MVKDLNSTNNSKDNEFKISLSIEDINKIDEEIKDIKNNSKKIPWRIKCTRGWVTMTDTEKDQNTTKGVSLLNVCTNCGAKFKPINSMINERLCNLCIKWTCQ